MIYGYARVSATPSYPSSLLCGTVGIGCKKVDWSEVVLRNGYVYKKFATEKFTSVNQTKNIQFHARQCLSLSCKEEFTKYFDGEFDGESE